MQSMLRKDVWNLASPEGQKPVVTEYEAEMCVL
jgi:hypothetical protein